MKEEVFENIEEVLSYLKELKMVDQVNSVRVKLKGLREVKNWVRVDGFEVVDGNLRIMQIHGGKVIQREVFYIYPIDQLETVRAIRHPKDFTPRVDIMGSSFGIGRILIERDLKLAL